MAVRGAKPRATAITVVLGNPGKRRLNSNEPHPDGKPSPPTPLRGRPLALWRRFVSRAWWLTATDSPKAWLWCHLHAEAEESVAKMTAARLGQLRALGSELGFDPASRSRLAGPDPTMKSPADRYF